MKSNGKAKENGKAEVGPGSISQSFVTGQDEVGRPGKGKREVLEEEVLVKEEILSSDQRLRRRDPSNSFSIYKAYRNDSTISFLGGSLGAPVF